MPSIPDSISDGQRATQMMRGLRPVDAVMFAFYLLLLTMGIAADHRDVRWFLALGGSVVCATLWIVARRQLGAAFSVRPEARQLVTKGLYRWLRHPIYVFGTAAFMLVLLALQGWSALVIWAVLIPLQIIRARREDKVLAVAFGAEYEAYRRSTLM